MDATRDHHLLGGALALGLLKERTDARGKWIILGSTKSNKRMGPRDGRQELPSIPFSRIFMSGKGLNTYKNFLFIHPETYVPKEEKHNTA